jgi:hypothetical protein
MARSTVNAPTPGHDYTRVSEDTAILCRRQDFPRAMNVLQRRPPDHRRWRVGLRNVATSAGRVLQGSRRWWLGGAIRELVSEVPNPWLQRELAVDLFATGTGFEPPDLLPHWTARDVWGLADGVGLPMEYVAQVTALPGYIDARVETARLVLDFRRTALAHHEHARRLAAATTKDLTEVRGYAPWAARVEIDAQRDAAERWRALAMHLLTHDPEA